MVLWKTPWVIEIYFPANEVNSGGKVSGVLWYKNNKLFSNWNLLAMHFAKLVVVLFTSNGLQQMGVRTKRQSAKLHESTSPGCCRKLSARATFGLCRQYLKYCLWWCVVLARRSWSTPEDSPWTEVLLNVPTSNFVGIIRLISSPYPARWESNYTAGFRFAFGKLKLNVWFFCPLRKSGIQRILRTSPDRFPWVSATVLWLQPQASLD